MPANTVVSSLSAHHVVQAASPEFKVLPYLKQKNKPGLLELDFDLLLMTHLESMGMPADLKEIDLTLDGEIRRRIDADQFVGKTGEKIQLALPCLGNEGRKRRLLLLGIGEASAFCGKAARNTFKHFIEHALQEGVGRVVIPFISKRSTRNCLNLDRTASILATVTRTAVAEFGAGAKLQQVYIVCTPQAKPRIDEGLRLSEQRADACRCRDEVV